jgi:membrane-associated HD superfamily phosphohydrolase
MLADMTEAAVRTLEKPPPEKLDKYIQELISRKVEHGQLAQSELTFRDLNTIKNAFVRVLAGHYHSRIEYPRIENPKFDSRTENQRINNKGSANQKSSPPEAARK